MDIVTIDFETYYTNEYSLSKMTMEAYIRDPRFEIIGVAVKVNDHPTDWYSGDNPGKFLKSLDYSKRAILCHNAAFDGAILSWHFGIRPRLWLDTLSMSRPLHGGTVGGSLAKLAKHYELGEKGSEVVAALGKRRSDFTNEELAQYGRYCINDVDLTKALFDRLKVGFPVGELIIIDQAIRMYTEPVIELDVPLLQAHLEEVRERKRALIAELQHKAGEQQALQDTLMSNDKFAEYLKELGVEPPTKVSPRTGKTTWAFAKTDKGMTDLLEHPDERVQAAVAARLGVKSTIEETRTEALIDVAQRGRLPILLNYYGAHTGRFSGGDGLNLQNLPSRGNTTIRKALKAPPGYVLIACDSSQIEARVVAWLAEQNDLLQAFAEKRDVYSEFASEIYGRKITKADTIERFVGKTCIAEGTLVLTKQGWKPIESVTTNDLLWDGKEWVCHHGLLDNGIKPTLNLCGAWLTPDHLVLCDDEWVQAELVFMDDMLTTWALSTGLENMPVPPMRSLPTANKKSQTLKRVYDILNCGSRNRFTILTEAGPIIVHNCVLGLGYGMGAEKFRRTLEIGQGGVRVSIDLNEAERIVRLYRQRNWKIVQLWQRCGNILRSILHGSEGELRLPITYDKNGIRLPNGFYIQYPLLHETPNGFLYISDPRAYQKFASGWAPDSSTWTKIYSGKVVENLTQALAALVIREQMAAIGTRYKVVFQVHDEIIITAPEAEAEIARAELEKVMSTPPKWAPDLPVACESGMAKSYGET